MKQVWETEDGELFADKEAADNHEKHVQTNAEISNWVAGRTWTDEIQARWLIQVLHNNYADLRDFLKSLP